MIYTVEPVSWWRHQMELFSALLALWAGNSSVTGEFPHKGQWRGALMFSSICAWMNDSVNNREAGDLIRYRAHCDVTVMEFPCSGFTKLNYPFFRKYHLSWETANIIGCFIRLHLDKADEEILETRSTQRAQTSVIPSLNGVKQFTQVWNSVAYCFLCPYPENFMNVHPSGISWCCH